MFGDTTTLGGRPWANAQDRTLRPNVTRMGRDILGADLRKGIDRINPMRSNSISLKFRLSMYHRPPCLPRLR